MISDESLRNLVALGERVPAALAHAQATGEWEVYNAAGVKARTAWADEAVGTALAAELLAARARPAGAGGERPMTDEERERLGRLVREVWVEWAQEQPNPKPHHLLPWEELDEGGREVDRRIGEAVARAAVGPELVVAARLRADLTASEAQVARLREALMRDVVALCVGRDQARTQELYPLADMLHNASVEAERAALAHVPAPPGPEENDG